MDGLTQLNRRSQAGFGLLQVMISLAIMGVSMAGYLESVNAAVRASKRQADRQDTMMARAFVRKHFSCDKSLDYNPATGAFSCPKKNLSAKTIDGRVFANASGFDFGTTSGKEPFSLKVLCTDSAIGPRVSFLARRKGTNPITGKSYDDPLSLAVYAGALAEDVTQGNEILCPPIPPIEPPPDPQSCSVSLISLGDNRPLSTISGPAFREPKNSKFAWRVLVKGEIPDSGMDDNKPDSFEIQFVNKDPEHTVSYARRNKKFVARTGTFPDSDLNRAGNKPMPGEVFSIKAPNVSQSYDKIPSNCKLTGSSVSQLSYTKLAQRKTGTPAQKAFCNSTFSWQSDILPEHTQNRNRKNPESDWYDSPVDMKVTAMKGGNRIATCTTSFRLISPLALLWPEGGAAHLPDSYELRPTITRFDLDGDGVRDTIGWVTGKSGFLALDLNGNHTIDDGRELFGDATLNNQNPRRQSSNGFEALAQYDLNGDRIIDQDDEVMSRLLVWFDSDGNGASDPSEVVPLSMMGVNRIDLNNQAVRDAPKGAGGLVQARFEARFFGKELCAGSGCPVYDLYFGRQLHQEASLGPVDKSGQNP